ncbi:hypothetical protein [Lacinutrix sp.]|uniref:hypothetical protein n=1 Tax=Lacinutrix sp. TaxID=1937692 RepID=UPI0025B8811C|nr:hypothetical protein [Lacinutrix sp.]
MNTKNIILKNQGLKSLFFAGLKLVLITLVLSMSFSCSDEGCDYDDPCVESCEIFEDFEDETLGTQGNWIGITTSNVEFQTRNGSQVLFVQDGSGGTIAYNGVDFPRDFNAQGCALRLDIEYLSGSNNGLTTDNGIGVYSDTDPLNAAVRAFFILNASNLITSGNPPTTIEVPLELASGTTLPSNSFGTWVINPSTTPAADVASFNTLIQNAQGVYFAIDEGENPAEQWWFDNFCFKQCCPN